jgi:hypothetical protein
LEEALNLSSDRILNDDDICICSEQKYNEIVKIAMNKGMHLHCIPTNQILVIAYICFVINFHHVLQVYRMMQTTVWPKHVAGVEK